MTPRGEECCRRRGGAGPRALGAVLAAFALAWGACAEGAPTSAEPTIEEVRAATEKYRDVQAAIADGYVRDPMDLCETPYHMGSTEQTGVMGVHFLRLDLLGIDSAHTRLDVTGTHTDFREPAALVYEPQADGSLTLVAVENMVSAAAWRARGHEEPPAFHGEPYEFRADDAGMSLAAHYDKHLWLFRENPSGVSAQYNPTVTCQHHVYNVPMMHPPGHGNMSSVHDTTAHSRP